MSTQQTKDVKCKHCNTTYPATKENFYSDKGKLKLSICKGCRKEKSRISGKNRNPRVYVYRDRKEYSKMYYIKNKLKKQELTIKDI